MLTQIYLTFLSSESQSKIKKLLIFFCSDNNIPLFLNTEFFISILINSVYFFNNTIFNSYQIAVISEYIQVFKDFVF